MPQRLTQELLKSLLRYDPETGVFTWLADRPNHIKGGAEAGSAKTWRKRRYIDVAGAKYAAHRLAWFYMTGAWPKGVIDHKDRNSLNNVWTNLRDTDAGGNCKNRGMGKNNTSGIKGVYWHKTTSKWLSNIRANGKIIHLGIYAHKEDAAAAYAVAAVKYHGEFAAVVRA
jgi:hypothetical protein